MTSIILSLPERLFNLRNQHILCDITLHVGNNSPVPAHRAVLAASSAYILDLCSNEESTNTSIMNVDLSHVNVDKKAVDAVLDYMYGLPVLVAMQSYTDVACLAHALKLDQLVTKLGKGAMIANKSQEENDTSTGSEKVIPVNSESDVKMEPAELQDNVISMTGDIDVDSDNTDIYDEADDVKPTLYKTPEDDTPETTVDETVADNITLTDSKPADIISQNASESQEPEVSTPKRKSRKSNKKRKKKKVPTATLR